MKRLLGIPPVLVGLGVVSFAGVAGASGVAATSTTGTVPTFTVSTTTCADKDLTQMQLTACAGEKAAKLEVALAAALATESRYWGSQPVHSVLQSWVAFVSNECTMRTAINVGGTIYPMLFENCVGQLAKQYLADVEGTDAALKRAEVPKHPAAKYVVAIRPNQ